MTMINARIAPDLRTEPRRREPRMAVEAAVPMRGFGAAGVDATLVNISSRGFMAETDADIEVGSRVWLSLPGHRRVSALVLWTKNGRLGGQFAEPIDPLKVFHALGRSLPH
jgi:hypothetical protein